MMEVDVLRPGSVPLSEETLLWFEFLLKPSLLDMHLKKAKPDPSPIDLIQLFLSVTPDPQIQAPTEPNSPDSEATKKEGLQAKIGRKQLALKILALKVAAHLHFNLDIIEKSLPLSKQVQLLSDLCTVTSGKIQNLPISLVHECVIGPDGSKHSLTFALTLYHRFILRAQVRRGCQTKTNKVVMIPPGPDPNLIPTRDDYFISSMEALTQNSIDFLTQIMEDGEQFKLLTYECFLALDAHGDNVMQKFDAAQPISKIEVQTQIYFDLCIYFLFIKNFVKARENVIKCRDSLRMLKHEYALKGKKDFMYCTVDEEELEAYLLACGIFEEDQSLLLRMNKSIMSKYEGIVDVLKEDNLRCEIPVVQRKILELDIEGSISTAKFKNNGKELEVYHIVIALNTIRYVVNEDDTMAFDLFIEKYKNVDKVLGTFFETITDTYTNFDLTRKNKLKQFVLRLVMVLSDTQLNSLLKPSSILTQQEIKDLRHQKTEDAVTVSGIAQNTNWSFTEGKTMMKLEIAHIERQLINSSNPKTSRSLLVRLASMNPAKPLWNINPSWSIPDPIRSLILSLPRGFLQDFSYVLTGKAKELAVKCDFHTANTMLIAVKNETQRADFASNPNVVKLGKLIQYEMFFIQNQQCLEEWPKKPIDIVRNSKQLLATLTNNETVIPRLEILEAAASMLLNFCEWQSVLLTEKRTPYLDLCSAIATAIIDIDKLKGQGQKKVNKEPWDMILPLFLNQPASGNNTKRQSGRDSRDSPSLQQTFNLNAFLKRLRDPFIISIMLSLLSRLHNALKDDGNFEIYAEYMILWPATVSNANGYNIKAVSETINILLKQAFKYYPTNISWLKLKGDLEFVNGSYESAMKYYVTVLITGSEYCTVPLVRPTIDEHIIRRMIKCTTNLGSYMQAAILCQFLDETDYCLAFKSITEKTYSFSDAMDAYYGCIWDVTLLEFIINMHSKKGEHKRKLQAISYMGLLELNGNNNDEIKREAAHARKVKFLRSLAKQYMLT